jgi:hypothetical protein
MIYFARISATYVDKNKAYKQIGEYFQSIGNTLLISNEEKQQFISNIIMQVYEINKANPRCKDIKVDTNYFDNDIQISTGNVMMVIHPVRNNIPVDPELAIGICRTIIEQSEANPEAFKGMFGVIIMDNLKELFHA